MVVGADVRRDVLRRLVQPLVPFLGVPGLAMVKVLLELRPQALVGGCYLSRDITRHLRGEVEEGAYLPIGSFLQAIPV